MKTKSKITIKPRHFSNKTKWELFTKRTNEPKLSYLEERLHQAGIKYKREGRSFHAPCIYVDANQASQAWDILSEKWLKKSTLAGAGLGGRTPLDEIPDDDARFEAFDEYQTPQQMGWVGQDGLP